MLRSRINVLWTMRFDLAIFKPDEYRLIRWHRIICEMSGNGNVGVGSAGEDLFVKSPRFIVNKL